MATSSIVSSTRLDLSSGQPVSFLFINELAYNYSCAVKGRSSRGLHVGEQPLPSLLVLMLPYPSSLSGICAKALEINRINTLHGKITGGLGT